MGEFDGLIMCSLSLIFFFIFFSFGQAVEREKEAWAEEQRKREEEQLRRLGTFNAMKQAERGAELVQLKKEQGGTH